MRDAAAVVKGTRSLHRGSYVLIIDLAQDTTLEIGSLGSCSFKAGLYAYVGSAQSGLESRVGRHFSKKKKRHWHIDYLLEVAEPISAFLVEGPDNECEINGTIDRFNGSEVVCKGFGSSDCDCPAHLHRIEESVLPRLLNELS
ncbi:MAG: GIY-YIG nuclease family protein [Methanomassiliicoccales archaeon]|nr:MAG: GIY-YIG nuclease family protein [Methanomassiliicoccales archaeon]